MYNTLTQGAFSFPLLPVLHRLPQAIAHLQGSPSYPSLSGNVKLYQTVQGVLVFAEITGLPASGSPCSDRFFGFHIHEGSRCSGSEADPFGDTLSHYNPKGCEHPFHGGDFPSLLGNNGYALSLFLTNRFSTEEVIGKTIVLHEKPDDFTTQPSGNSGAKIACGEIIKI